MIEPSERDRIEGGLLGLLIGDALGVPYEFCPPEAIPALDEIELSPPRSFTPAHSGIPPGTWSDDGAQALCLLSSLLERGTLDPSDLGRRLVDWLESGALAVDGLVFDCGVQTHEGLRAVQSGVPALDAGPDGERDNGNGSLMRVLPLALWHRAGDEELVEFAAHQSRPTHGHPRSQLCCGLYCLWARRVLAGDDPLTGFDRAAGILREICARDRELSRELEDEIDPDREPGGSGSGYVVDCLHTARAALEAGPYEEAVKAAVAFGNDTDTTAAVAGGIAGIRDGVHAIPSRWREGLRGTELLAPLLSRLLDRVAPAVR